MYYKLELNYGCDPFTTLECMETNLNTFFIKKNNDLKYYFFNFYMLVYVSLHSYKVRMHLYI